MQTPSLIEELPVSPRRRALTEHQLRTMTDRERAEWVQAALPDKFVTCPACASAHERDGCAQCLGTRKLSKAGARAWFADQGLDARELVA